MAGGVPGASKLSPPTTCSSEGKVVNSAFTGGWGLGAGSRAEEEDYNNK